MSQVYGNIFCFLCPLHSSLFGVFSPPFEQDVKKRRAFSRYCIKAGKSSTFFISEKQQKMLFGGKEELLANPIMQDIFY